jgi:two-component system chemotaxis response regulator CheY
LPPYRVTQGFGAALLGCCRGIAGLDRSPDAPAALETFAPAATAVTSPVGAFTTARQVGQRTICPACASATFRLVLQTWHAKTIIRRSIVMAFRGRCQQKLPTAARPAFGRIPPLCRVVRTAYNSRMPTTFLLIGHCGPDSAYLRHAVRSAVPDATILAADDDAELQHALAEKIDLILLNRELGYGFAKPMGVDLIAELKQTHPSIKTMLVSNYSEAQTAAVAAGSLPGFGKRELGKPHVVKMLRDAVE